MAHEALESEPEQYVRTERMGAFVAGERSLGDWRLLLNEEPVSLKSYGGIEHKRSFGVIITSDLDAGKANRTALEVLDDTTGKSLGEYAEVKAEEGQNNAEVLKGKTHEGEWVEIKRI